MPRNPDTYKCPSRLQAEAPKPAMPKPGIFGPCDHLPDGRSKISTRSDGLPLSSMPPIASTLPFQAPAASARRLKSGTGNFCQPALASLKSYASASVCQTLGDLPSSFQPPTTYSRSPITTALCDERATGSGPRAVHWFVAGLNSANSSVECGSSGSFFVVLRLFKPPMR